jgi:hypothetical protein
MVTLSVPLLLEPLLLLLWTLITSVRPPRLKMRGG